MFWKITIRMKWIKIFCSWMIAVKSWNVNRMMNHKLAEKYEMISKACENFSKDKRIENIYDDLFQKICCLSIIKTENDHNLKSRLFKFLKLSALNNFSLSIKFIEFFVVRFNIFFFTLIKFIKSLVARLYAFDWTIKSVKYNSVLELKLIKN